MEPGSEEIGSRPRAETIDERGADRPPRAAASSTNNRGK
jgi:hypothetical protein